jgi:hypothetical protein
MNNAPLKQQSLYKQADLRTKQADLRTKQADLRTKQADLRTKQANPHATSAYKNFWRGRKVGVYRTPAQKERTPAPKERRASDAPYNHWKETEREGDTSYTTDNKEVKDVERECYTSDFCEEGADSYIQRKSKVSRIPLITRKLKTWKETAIPRTPA